MSFAADLKTLYSLALAPVRGASHAERLESFYGRQAADYDAFRARLLHGREALWQALRVPPDGVWIDLGGGTGANVELLGERRAELRRLYVVDLAPSLLRRAQARIAAHGWRNVTAVEADATTFVPPEGQADVVTFSYSLTMIPDWFAALEQARRLLRPGGLLGVVDFYVARKYPPQGRRRHSRLARHLWPAWFASDNVYLSADHVPYLQARFTQHSLHEATGSLPYVPLLRVPYYWFIGSRPAESATDD